jgi:hypothetical protein
MEKKKKGKKNNYLSHILAFLGGILVTALFNSLTNYKVEEFFNRPKVTCSIDCISIFKDDENNMILNLYVQYKNSGKTNTTISLSELNLQFKGINDNPYQYDLTRNIKINALSCENDTIKLTLPNKFDSITNTPTIKNVELKYREVDKERTESFSADSSNVIHSMFFGLEELQYKDSFNNGSDYKVGNGQTTMIFRKIPIPYHGKTYVNMLYPREAQISYMLRDDKIHIKYGNTFNLSGTKHGQTEYRMKPLVFIPAHELEDKVVLPNGYVLTYSYESKEKNKMV